MENLFKRDDRTSCKKIPIGQTFLMFVVGKGNCATCFRTFKLLSYNYRGQKKSWMDKNLLENKFLQWITTLDDRIGKPC